jgi:hypothetical protein
MKIQELKEKIEKELNKLSYEIMESLINNKEAQKSFQKYMDLSEKRQQETLTAVMKEIDERLNYLRQAKKEKKMNSQGWNADECELVRLKSKLQIPTEEKE